MSDFVTYDATKNPEGAYLPGVPLANLSAAEFNAFPLWLRHSVCGSPFYSVPADTREAIRLAINPPKPEPEPTPIQPNDEVINDE